MSIQLSAKCGVEGASDAEATPVEDVCVPLCGLDGTVAQELLDRANVVVGLKEMRGEGVPQAVTGSSLVDPCLAASGADGSL